MSNQELPHDLEIATKIKKMISSGVSMQVIFDTVKEMKNGPRSLTTFYKVYRGDITTARANLHESIGSLIMEKAVIERDYKALEFVAKTKLGWNEKVVVEEKNPDDLDQDTSAIDDLIAALNIKEKKE